MTRTAALLAAALAAPALAQDQSVMVSLTHDDADSKILIGDTVTWTLSISFSEDALAASGINATILGDDTLGNASNFSYQSFNGGFNGGNASGAGIDLVSFFNVAFFEGEQVTDNPLTVGTFDFTATAIGTLDYQIDRGVLTAAFVTIAENVFADANFQNPEDVTINTQTLTIVPTPMTAAPLALAGLIATRRRRS